MIIAWDITSKCNLSCKHCYNFRLYDAAGVAAKTGDLSTSDILAFLQTLPRDEVEHIQFLGGEPFARQDMLEILRYAQGTGICCNVATNGILLDDETIVDLAEIAPSQIAFSIDGATPASNDCLRGKGSFEKSVGCLGRLSKYFHEKGCTSQIGIQCTINQANIAEITPIVTLAKSQSLDFVSFDALKALHEEARAFLPSREQTWDCLHQIARLMAQERAIDISVLNFGSPRIRHLLNEKYGLKLQVDRYCPAGSETMYIRADGLVSPCNYCSDFPLDILHGAVQHQELSVARHTFEEIVDSEYLKSFYTFAHYGALYEHLPYCKDCPLFETCEPCPLDVARYGEGVNTECRQFDQYIAEGKRNGHGPFECKECVQC